MGEEKKEIKGSFLQSGICISFTCVNLGENFTKITSF